MTEKEAMSKPTEAGQRVLDRMRSENLLLVVNMSGGAWLLHPNGVYAERLMESVFNGLFKFGHIEAAEMKYGRQYYKRVQKEGGEG